VSSGPLPVVVDVGETAERLPVVALDGLCVVEVRGELNREDSHVAIPRSHSVSLTPRTRARE
jgi:hypothetical protein